MGRLLVKMAEGRPAIPLGRIPAQLTSPADIIQSPARHTNRENPEDVSPAFTRAGPDRHE